MGAKTNEFLGRMEGRRQQISQLLVLARPSRGTVLCIHNILSVMRRGQAQYCIHNILSVMRRGQGYLRLIEQEI
jgi:hypothetical protein